MAQYRAATGEPRVGEGPLPTGTVTFLFTDIEGSTTLLREAGPAYGALLAEHRRLLRAAFAVHAGREVDTQGDSFFVAFTGPAQAVAAAVDGQRALAAHPWAPGCAVRVRMGLHTGEAAAVAGSYVSLAVHRAARIAAAAHGGQVLLSEATAALVRDDLPDGAALRDLGEHRLKDFEGPARLFQLDLPDLPSRFPPPRTLGRRSPLPVLAGAFVGREHEVVTLATMLREHGSRLVTLTGPGGIGKTRLSLEAARAVEDDFPGGAVFLPLAAVTDHRVVLGAIAEALGTRREAGVDLNEAVGAVVGTDRTLLVLDNVEQVAAAATDLAELVDRVPALVVLVTSRSVLRLRSEQQFPVRPLPEPDAVSLFLERAAAVRPDFEPDDEDRASVLEICRRLDGVPLAIELATARLRVLPPTALLDRLADRLEVLGTGPVDLPERQRTLRATVDWSLGLLTAHEQALFARLAVFAGGWSLDAAEQVCARPDEPGVLDTLAALVDASLVVADVVGTEPRFSMLETIRVYAVERLADRADRSVVERSHAAWVLALTADLMRAHGRDYPRASQRVDRERANLRAAARHLLDTGDVASLALLVRNAVAPLALRDSELEALRWLDEALEHADTAEPAVRGRLIVLRAVFSVGSGETARIPALVAEGAPLLPQDADFELDRALAAIARIQTGFLRGIEHAIAAAEDALTLFTAMGLEVGQVAMNNAVGDLALAMGDSARAESRYRAAAELARSIGEDGMLGPVLSMLGLSQVARGDVAAARRSVLEGAEVNRRSGNPTSIAYSVEGLAGLALAEGRADVAARAFAAAEAARGRSALPLTPAMPALIERMVAKCRAQLGDDAFEEASAVGASWSLLDALRRTLDAAGAMDEDAGRG